MRINEIRGKHSERLKEKQLKSVLLAESQRSSSPNRGGPRTPLPLLELLSLLINVPSAFSKVAGWRGWVVVRRQAASLGQPGLQVWLQSPPWRGDSSPTAREDCARPHTDRGLTAEDSAPAWVGHGHRKSKPRGAGLCLRG